ncbi:30S ribosomal protein S8 domain protein, partial [Ostertagia ostertagi]
MTDFRRIYREIEARDKNALHFIDTVLLIARQARNLEVTRRLETKTILDNFKALPQSSRDYLIMKFPPLKFLDSSFTEKPPGSETSTSQPSATRTPIFSSVATTITSPH